MGITLLNPRAHSAFQGWTVEDLPPFLELESQVPPEEILKSLPERGLAVVGTRNPLRQSLERIDRALRELRPSGLWILSGFARGVDTRAHEAALEQGLRTLAILGCGLDIDYPRGGRTLRNRILQAGGAILSPFPRGTPPFASNFLERNALIAGLSRAVWVVEAAAVSGTLNTAHWAMRLHRDLYATSCFPGDARFEGNEKLLSQRSPDRYPIAQSFFGAHSLSATWPGLALLPEGTRTRAVSVPGTPLQGWIDEIRREHRDCHLLPLLRHVAARGVDRKNLMELLQQGIREGSLRLEEDGRIVPCDQER